MEWQTLNDKRKRKSIEDIKNIAISMGGRLLSNNYKNNKEKLMWECRFGHRWNAILTNIMDGKWCPTCSKNKKLSLNHCYELAEKFNGKCLSTIYINAQTKYKWQCNKNHIWMATYNNIKTKFSWCPKCKISISEKLCKKVFENIFEENFISIFPKWLINDKTNDLMQLDGYCEKLNIAFEHNGEQHYSLHKKFHLTINDFTNQVYRDKLKEKLCKEQNIKLFIIPVLFYKTKIKNLLKLIEDQARQFNININISKIDIWKCLKECYE